jgi:ABC-type uncharacterized transport system permease subunit
MYNSNIINLNYHVNYNASVIINAHILFYSMIYIFFEMYLAHRKKRRVNNTKDFGLRMEIRILT